MRINDHQTLMSEFDVLSKSITKSTKVFADNGGIPRFLVRILCDLEDHVQRSLADKKSFKNLKPAQGRALSRMKLSVKKYRETYGDIMEEYRKNPVVSSDGGDAKSSSSSDSSSSSSDSSDGEDGKKGKDDDDDGSSDDDDDSSSSSSSSSDSSAAVAAKKKTRTKAKEDASDSVSGSFIIRASRGKKKGGGDAFCVVVTMNAFQNHGYSSFPKNCRRWRSSHTDVADKVMSRNDPPSRSMRQIISPYSEGKGGAE